MGAGVVVVELVWIGLLFAGCSGSSDVGSADGAAPQDSSAPQDALKPQDASREGSAMAAATDGGACLGLDAAISPLNVPAACETCIGSHCCSEAQACSSTPGCTEIEACATRCVAAGTAPMTCAVKCIEGDAGIADGGQLSSSQAAAEALDLCLATSCSSSCS